jgi:hypothetical protein
MIQLYKICCLLCFHAAFFNLSMLYADAVLLKLVWEL